MGIVERLLGWAKDLRLGYRILGADQDLIKAADLIERLRGYAAHSDECAINAWMPRGDEPCPPCTCGLTALIKEIERD